MQPLDVAIFQPYKHWHSTNFAGEIYKRGKVPGTSRGTSTSQFGSSEAVKVNAYFSNVRWKKKTSKTGEKSAERIGIDARKQQQERDSIIGIDTTTRGL
jgi:hypothetical protein